MNKEEYRTHVLNTKHTSLYCSIKEGVPALEYFTMADIYSTYRVNLGYDDLRLICDFLDNWGSEGLEITQPYSTKVNGHPSFCVLKFEYVKNERSRECPRDTLQRVTFYARCWGEDLEDSLKEEKILSWTSWDDYYNWEDFEKMRSFLYQMKSLMELFKAGELE